MAKSTDTPAVVVMPTAGSREGKYLLNEVIHNHRISIGLVVVPVGLAVAVALVVVVVVVMVVVVQQCAARILVVPKLLVAA